MRKFIFVTGEKDNEKEKCLVSASVSLLLESRGFKLSMRKLSSLLNVDFAITDPNKCGEVFVTSDGTETDGDIGLFERFVSAEADSSSFITLGKLLRIVTGKERTGDFLGEPVRLIPHVTDEVMDFITASSVKPDDIVVVLVGGAFGEAETIPFFETIGLAKKRLGIENVLHIHVAGGGDRPLCDLTVSKAAGCDSINENYIYAGEDSYGLELPLVLEKAGLAAKIIKKLSLADFKSNLSAWREMTESLKNRKKSVNIKIVSKYSPENGSCQSLSEAVSDAFAAEGLEACIDFLVSSDITDDTAEVLLGKADGIIVADGRGREGTDGMFDAARFARERDIPFLGIGLGMHMAVVEFAANVLGMKGATSAEFSSSAPYLVVVRSDEFRVGSYRCTAVRNSKIFFAYDRELFEERHRQSYVINNAYRNKFENGGLCFVATSRDGKICEAVELTDKKWFLGVQFRPEFMSGPVKPHPVLRSFAKAAASMV